MRPGLAIAVLCCALRAVASGQEQKAFVRLEVNGVEKGDAMAVLQQADVLIKESDLSAAGLRDLAGRRVVRGADAWVSLSSLSPALRYRFDPKAVVLRLTVDPKHLPANTLDFSQSPRPADMTFSPASSMFVNYAFETTEGARPSGFTEAGLSIGTALAYSAASMRSDGLLVRGLSNLTLDSPGSLRRTVLGDFFAGGSPLGSGLTLLGLSFAREMSLDPYFVAAPHQDFRGATGTPSKVEIYDGDRLVRTETLAPGPFELQNVPGYGANTRLVVRDAFGRTQEFAAGVRSTAALLAPGLTDFSYQIGLQRNAFGVESFSYGAPALVARHRVGVTPFLTMGARGEAGLDVASFGPTLTTSTPLGNLDLAFAGSRSGQSNGAAAWGSYGISFRYLSVSGDATWMSPRYSNLSLAPLTDRPRLSLRLQGSTTLGPVNFSGGYTAAFQRDGAMRRRYSGSATTRLGDHFSLFAEASMDAGRPDTLTFYAGLTFMLGRTTTTASASGAPGSATPALVSQMPLPVGSGVGYTLRSQGGPSPQGSAEVQAQGAYGLVHASYGRTQTSQTWTAGVAGALIGVDGALFATRPVQQGYALVQVPGVRDVRVYLNNQEMGRTDSGGRLLLPDVLPYYGNKVRIADNDLPFDYTLQSAERTIAGPVRGSALARFEAHRVVAYTGRIILAGAPAPMGTVLWLDGKSYPLGLDGRFYLENVAPGRRVAELDGDGGPCKVTLDLGETQLPIRDIGSIGCFGGALAGRLFIDENGDGRYESGEPLLDGVRLTAGGTSLTTGQGGHYASSSGGRIAPANPLEIPAGFSLGTPGASGDLPVRKPKPLRDLGAALVLDLPGGPVRMMQLQAATIPLKTWLGGGGLSEKQDAAVQRLGTDVLDSPTLRVLVVVHPAQGQPAAAWPDALKAARATVRYLRGLALVPASRLIWTMADPGSGEPQGSVDILLVRVPN